MFQLIAFLSLFLTFQNSPHQESPKVTEARPVDSGSEIATRLLKIHRICVESFGDDQISRQLNAMVINALSESKRFTITEKCEKADATLKGVSTQQAHQEAHSSSEETSVGGSASSSGLGSSAGRSSHVGISDSSHSTETIENAHLAVRLVDGDSGDVIWSTTQESNGAKYKGAAADAADKVVKQLLWDLEKLEKLDHEQTQNSEKKSSLRQ
jgi:hypothetical protein